MTLASFIEAMPKIELHVHMEGSIRPETLLALAKRHNVKLPADTVEGLREWYTFTDFDHFIQVYLTISRCLRTPEDIELIARQFLIGQAAQNIIYSEVTYTPYNQFCSSGMRFPEQLTALNRARSWAARELNVQAGFIFDISRQTTPEEGLLVADWAVSGMGGGVVALGLGGPEVGNPPEKFEEAFAHARAARLPGVPHAGETEGPASIWGALNALQAVRIGHGVRCLEDAHLVEELRRRGTPLDVCPTSNVCLKVTPNFESHPLPELIKAGLVVTLNSDDPPLFNTTLTQEYLKAADAFHFDAGTFETLVFTALRVSLLQDVERRQLEHRLKEEFARLRVEHMV
jgi:adenosine deaminase